MLTSRNNLRGEENEWGFQHSYTVRDNSKDDDTEYIVV